MPNLIINVALTGAVPDKKKFPKLPQTPEEIVDDVSELFSLGAHVFHIHMRDSRGLPTQDIELYRETIKGIRETTPGAIICATTSSRASGSFEDRLSPLKLEKELLPDLASLSLGSFNFPSSISINPPSEIRDLLKAMNEVGVRPELEVFEPGMINFAKTLEMEGLLIGKKIFNVLLGNSGSSPFDFSSLGHFASVIPADSEWAIAGIGRHQKDAIATAIAMGTNIRLGMEDAPNVSKDGQWSNRKAVEFAISMAEALGREIETTEGARKRMGLKA